MTEVELSTLAKDRFSSRDVKGGGDAEVKAWATKASSSVQAHLTHAMHVQRELQAATH